MEMVANADLSPDHHAVTHDSAAGDSHLAANDTISSKPDIVRNVHEVIENGSRSDRSIARRTSVYRAVRANLDIVFYDDATKLRNAQAPIRRRHEAEALSANADTGRDLNSGAYDGVAYAAVCPNCAIVAKHDAAADHRMTSDVTTGPDFCARADNGSRVDSRGLPNDSRRIDPCIGGDLRLWSMRRIIQKADPRKSQLRLGYAHETYPTRSVPGEISGRDNGGRVGCAKGIQILRMIEETQLTGASRVQRRDVANHDVPG